MSYNIGAGGFARINNRFSKNTAPCPTPFETVIFALRTPAYTPTQRCANTIAVYLIKIHFRDSVPCFSFFRVNFRYVYYIFCAVHVCTSLFSWLEINFDTCRILFMSTTREKHKGDPPMLSCFPRCLHDHCIYLIVISNVSCGFLFTHVYYNTAIYSHGSRFREPPFKPPGVVATSAVCCSGGGEVGRGSSSSNDDDDVDVTTCGAGKGGVLDFGKETGTPHHYYLYRCL